MPNEPHPPRKKIRLERDAYALPNRAYFFTVCSYQGRAVFSSEDLNKAVIALLAAEASRLDCAVYTFCLMPDHVHFLVSPNRDGVSVLSFVDAFKSATTRAWWGLGGRGKLWQARYHDHVVRTDESLRAIAEYVLNNPVRRGLVATAEDWPWGGHLRGLPL